MTKFHVHFNAADMDGKAVLVFIKPESPQRNSRIHAWQVLIGTEGWAEFFHYGDISVNVTPVDSEPSTPHSPDTIRVLPGQLYEAVSKDGRSLVLHYAGPNRSQLKLTREQCGVINTANPFMAFDCHWFVGDRPVVTMPRVDTNMTVSFQYLHHLYFMVAEPPTAGQTYVIKDFSPMTRYVMQAGAQIVDVNLTRDNGLWTFGFSSSH